MKLSLKRIILLSLTILTFVIFGCSSSSGETATISISLGIDNQKAASNVSISDLRHSVTLTGPTGKISLSISGSGSARASVVPGNWRIDVEGFYGNDLYSTGSASVTVKAGQTANVTVNMSVVYTPPGGGGGGGGGGGRTPKPPLDSDHTVNSWTELSSYIHSLTPTPDELIVERTIMLNGVYVADSTIDIAPTTPPLTLGEEIKVTLISPPGKRITIVRATSPTPFLDEMFFVNGNGILSLGNEGYPENSMITLDGMKASVAASSPLIAGVSNSTLNIFNEVVLQNNSNISGLGGAIRSFGPININGGTIRGNEAQFGGGVHVSRNFIMSGGTIGGTQPGDGNIAVGDPSNADGGGVYVNSGLIMQMSGNAAIIGNSVESSTCDTRGGGVYFNSSAGDLEISGNAKINGNYSTNSGSGDAYGGGVFFAGLLNLTMSGDAEIIGNKAEASSGNAEGGGVYFNSSTQTFSLSGSAKINENSAIATGGGSDHGRGGGVNVAVGTLSMTGGEINGNRAVGDVGNCSGGGVYVDGTAGASFTKNGGTIDGHGLTGPDSPSERNVVYDYSSVQTSAAAARAGHAVYVQLTSTPPRRSHSQTAGPGVNLDSSTSGNWDNES